MKTNLSFAEKFTKITTLDMHTGGEPLRIVLEGYPELKQQAILETRRLLEEQYDYLRKALMWEPRGHADMYGLIKVAPERKDSDFGVIFMHNAGYSTMCGHATIAIAKAAVVLGWVKATPPITTIKIDAPCGQLTAYVKHKEGTDINEVEHVSFENVASFYVGSFQVDITELGLITYDLAYGGAFYAYLDVAQLGITCGAEHYLELIRLGRIIKHCIMESNEQIVHPFEKDLSFLYGTIFIEASNKPNIHSKNVCVFADGELDRCATGSGVSGRAAIHFTKGELALKETITIESIVESTLTVSLKKVVEYGAYKQAVIPLVTGDAYFTGHQQFWIDSEDPLKDGFFIR